MSWEMAVFGDLEIPTRARAKWRAAPLEGKAFTGWTGYLREVNDARTVKTLIEELERFPEEGFVQVVEGEGKFSIRGLLPKDSFMDWGPQIATLFRAAGPLGGKGELYFIGYLTTDLAYSVQVGDGSSKLSELTDAQRRRAEKRPGFAEVAALVDGLSAG